MQSEHEVFTEALSFNEAAARAEYLDRVCGNDTLKRQRLNDLLNLHESVDSVLDRKPQEIIESLNDTADDSDLAQPQPPTVILATLQPFLEPPSQTGSLGRLGHYELLEILGQGGYGCVFKSFDTKLSRLVAVKVLSPHLATTSPPRRRFLREARAAAAVRHEHVVQIYAVEESPIPYLVMEFISGETLQQRSDRLGPLDPAEVIRLGQQIARGLEAAHAQGLIHRDIKPGNILVADGIEPMAKLSDFGLARTVDDASQSQSGVVIGTPMYMSPEQVSGDEVDQRTDLFSFGSVLYLMVTGRPPFRATSTLAVLKRVAEGKPRTVRDIIADAPMGLCEVISRLHAKSRDERYLTAREVDTALETCLAEPAMTWRRRWVEFCSTRNGRVLAATVAVLMLGGACLAIAASAGRNDWSSHEQVADGSQTNIPNSPLDSTTPSVVAETLVDTIVDHPAVAKPGPTTTESKTETTTGTPGPASQSAEVVLLTDWDKSVMGMSAEDQIITVLAKLKQLNPGLDESSFKPGIRDGVVSSLWLEQANNLADISPLRALRNLTELRIIGNGGNVTDLTPLKGINLTHFEIIGQPVRDLSPLKGMPIKTISLWRWEGDDLSPLRGMPLIHGNFGGNNLRDLEPLRGMKLEMACFNYSLVEDLSPLRGMPLTRLEVQNTSVTNLLPLAGMPLDFLAARDAPIADFSPINGSKLSEITMNYDATRDKGVLQSLPELKTVNGRPVAAVLENP